MKVKSQKLKVKTEAGQVVIILLLTIVVALAIGLSISTRSISEISTATKIEQSSRAYSAAEAGIEKVLQDIAGGKTGSAITSSVPNLGNQSKADISVTELFPSPGDRRGIEYGFNGIGRDETAHVWLADPAQTSGISVHNYYTQPTFDVYFGNPFQSNDEDKPAIEVNTITFNGTSYLSKKLYFDSRSGRNNNFITAPDPTYNFSCDSPTVSTIISSNSQFFCKVRIQGYIGTPVLVRVRLLYSSTKQKVAISPTTASPCNSSSLPTDNSCILPPQITLITSTGISADVTRKVQLFQQRYVVPAILDFALFSNGDISVQ